MSRDRPYGDNCGQVQIQEARRIISKRQRQLMECKSDLVLGSISGSFVAGRVFERLMSSVRVVYPTSKRARAKSIAVKRSHSVRKVRSNTRHSVITPEHIARMHQVGLDKAKEMLKATTQKGFWTAIHPIHKRYRADHLNLHRP